MGESRIVRLLKNRIYPTYQLHAVMNSKKTTPQNGLRLGALVVLEWICQRLGAEVPEELRDIPSPSRYREVGDDCLTSLHLNSGFVIDIVSLPEQGTWCLQVTEPDLGSDPGNPEQLRQAVPGRMIETNIGFRISGLQLECGFQTMISDPEGSAQEADVYRLAVVRRLIQNPDFGLKHMTVLRQEAETVSTSEQLKELNRIWRSEENQLPFVFFSSIPREEISMPVVQEHFLRPAEFVWRPEPAQRLVSRPERDEWAPYDTAEFAWRNVSLCRTYVLPERLFDRFAGLAKVSAQPGDIVVLEPERFGGARTVLAYKPSASRQKETIQQLRQLIGSYSRNKEILFGKVRFLSEGRKELLLQAMDATRSSEAISREWAEKLLQRDNQWKDTCDKLEEKYQALYEQLERYKTYQLQLEQEKEALRTAKETEMERCQALLRSREEEVSCLRRRLDQPSEHREIAAWVQKYFNGRLLLHPRALSMLQDRSAQSVSASLICDALDFLATDYWERRYHQISAEEMNSRCAQKYGRPFEVARTGVTTIEFTPSQYKIKYFLGARGKPVESGLDYHLRVGNAPENLLRIYFLHDDEKQLIVVGSLPKHLKAVTIR